MSISKPGKNQWHKTAYSGGTGFVNQYMYGTSDRPRIDEWGGGYRSTDYFRYTGNEQYGTPTVDATVGVVHKGASGSTRYPPLAAIEGSEPSPEEWLPPASNDTRVGQISLVKNDSQHPKSVLNTAFGTKDAKLATMTGVGIAANDSLKEGKLVEPSTNLSKHSSRTVSKLQERGVVPQGQAYPASNGLDFWESPLERYPSYNDEQVPQSDVQAGSKLVRDVMKRPRKMGERQMELPF